MNTKTNLKGVAFSFPDYLELVDWTGRVVRDDKAGAISDSLPPVLARLGIEQQVWLDTITHYAQRFFRAVGNMDKLKQLSGCRHCRSCNLAWCRRGCFPAPGSWLS